MIDPLCRVFIAFSIAACRATELEEHNLFYVD